MDKQAIRERVWDALDEEGLARFPFPPHGRIPNFEAAERAAKRLTDLPEWTDAATLKANPDAPQRYVRERALDASKTVYMAVPRLADERCFVRLDPATIPDPGDAATLSGMDEHGTPVYPDDVEPVDLVVVGSVAVTTDGARIGKGEGYSDLEFAVLSELGLVGLGTTVATTVHDRQVVADDVPVEAHDVPLDVVVTPERTIRVESPSDRPSGIDWDALDEGDVEEMPVLSRFTDDG